MKIKIFVGGWNTVEKEVNTWLEKEKPEVIEALQSESVYDGMWGITLTFLYE